MARVSNYLNFLGNTEEAFEFYRSVFGGEFIGGIARFADMPAQPDMPPLADADKKKVLHIELETIGGHVIMGTDALESMGMIVTRGDNMSINLEPDTREETERLFNSLSAGGTVTMPLADMFWGAYFGTFTDRFGINWMINFSTKS